MSVETGLVMTIESDRQALDGSTNPMTADDLALILKCQHLFQEKLSFDKPVDVSQDDMEVLKDFLK